MSRQAEKISRNAPCPCASGKKYKKCCLLNEAERHSIVNHLSPLLGDGYDLVLQGQGARGCERWAELWRALRPLLRPEMRTFASAGAVFPDLQYFSNWVDDFTLELRNAAVRGEPRFAEIGCEVCEFLLAQFVDEEAWRLLYVRGDLGTFHALADRFEDAERVLLELMREYPEKARGFVWLAEILLGLGRGEPPRDLLRARAMLERALRCEDAEDFDVEARIVIVDRMLAVSTAAAEGGSTDDQSVALP